MKKKNYGRKKINNFNVSSVNPCFMYVMKLF